MPIRSLPLIAVLLAGPALADPGAPPAPASPPPPLDVNHPYAGPDQWIFISPAGEPFRAPADQPYPVAAWFARADADKDGVLTQAEFVADALAFFETLDTDKDGVVDGFENSDYEKTVAPEITTLMRRPDQQGKGWSLFSRKDDSEGRSQRQGAAQYGLINEPHPVRGGDANLDQKVTRQEAEATARRRFQLLDKDGDGRLRLTDLPLTPQQSAFARKPEKK